MDDDDPDAVLYRKKTCPTCRTVVVNRPIPLFLIKSIAVAIDKAKGTGEPSSHSSPAPEGDPWRGIFPDDSDDMSDMYGYEDPYEYDPGYEMSDIDPYEYDSAEEEWPYDYGHDSDDEEPPYEGAYVHPTWEPPMHEVNPDDYPFELNEEMLSMLRRGATTPMIDIFGMSYSHNEGLRANVNGNVIYLGWKIDLLPNDMGGERFMEWIEADIWNRQERWERIDNPDGHTFTAWRLVREDEVAEEGEYETTDSEAYVPYADESEGSYEGDGYEDYYDLD